MVNLQDTKQNSLLVVHLKYPESTIMKHSAPQSKQSHFPESWHLLLPTILIELHHLDIQTTFLHADLEDEVCLQQPPYYEDKLSSSKGYLLRKAIYELRQSPRAWYHRLHIFFTQQTRLKTEPNIYIRKTN